MGTNKLSLNDRILGIGAAALLTVGLVCLSADPASGQTFNEYILQPDIWRPAKPLEPGVDAKGDLNLAIPVLTIPGRGGLDYPVTFSYRSGIRVHQQSSWIGLGWSFDPGSIARDVNGMIAVDQHYNVDYADSDVPAQPDAYYVTAPGLSFEMGRHKTTSDAGGGYTNPPWDTDGAFSATSSRAYKIEFVTESPVTVALHNTHVHAYSGTPEPKADFARFVITSENGTRYVFDKPTLETYVASDPSIDNHRVETYVSVWRLIAILGPDYPGDPWNPDLVSSITPQTAGSWIKFTYGYLESDWRDEDSYGKIVKQTRYLTKIETPTHCAQFVTGAKPTSEVRTEDDWQGDSADPNFGYKDFHRILTSIQLYRSSCTSGTLVREVEVGQSTGHSGYETSRMALNAVSFYGLGGKANGQEEPGYVFTYYGADGSVSSRYGEADRFGFFNLMGTAINTDMDDGRAWSLWSILHPTGLADVITYENDRVECVEDPSVYTSPCTKTVSYMRFYEGPPLHQGGDGAYGFDGFEWQGGARVTKIERFADPGSSPTYTTMYSYGDGQASGVPPLEFETSAGFFYLPAKRGQAAVYYAWVLATAPDGSKTKRFYTTPLTHSIAPITTANYERTINAHAVLQNNGDFLWGRLYKEEGDAGGVTTEKTFDLSTSHLAPIYTSLTPIYLLWNYDNSVQAEETTRKYTEETGTIATDVKVRREYTYDQEFGGRSKVQKTREISEGLPTRVTEYDYAYEKSDYDAMKTANMLTAVVQTRSGFEDPQTPSTVHYRSSSATTYKPFAVKILPDEPTLFEVWHPHRTFAWESEQTTTTAPAFTWWSEASEPPGTSAWKMLSKTERYADEGGLERVLDAIDTPTEIVWDNSGSVPVAAMVNGTASQVFADAFESGSLSGWTIVDADGADTDFLVESGKLKVVIDGTAENLEYDRVIHNFSTALTGSVVLEFDLQMGDGDSWDLQIAMGSPGWSSGDAHVWSAIYFDKWRCKNDTGSWTTIASGLVTGQTYHFKIVANTDTGRSDFYVDGELRVEDFPFRYATSSIGKIAFGSYGYGTATTTWYVDNVRVYPAGARVVTATYDPTLLKPSVITDDAGVSTAFTYDGFGRLLETFAPSGAPLAENAVAWSRDKNGGTYDTTDPNEVVAIAMTDPDGYSDFTSSEGWMTSYPYNTIIFGASIDGRRAVKIESPDGSYTNINKLVSAGNVIARADFYPTSSTTKTPHVIFFDGAGYRCAVQYSTAEDRFKVQQANDGTYQVVHTFQNLAAPPDTWYTVEIEKTQDGECHTWVSKKGSGRDPENYYKPSVSYPVNWTPTVRSSTSGTAFYLADHYAGPFQKTTTFIDHLGRELQTRALQGSGDRVTALQYDNMGRLKKSFLPFETSVRGFQTDSTVDSLTHDTYSPLADPGEATYAYSEQLYNQFGLLTATYPPATTAVTRSFVDIFEATEDYTDPQGVPNSLQGIVRRRTTDEDGLSTDAFIDAYGNEYLRRSFLDGASVDTRFAFDETGNVTKAQAPNCTENLSACGPGDWTTHYAYDSRGRLRKKSTADADGDGNLDPADEVNTSASDYRYKYDRYGNLRFVEDPNRQDSGSEKFLYTLYDDTGRAIETGIYTGTTSFDGANPDTAAFPSADKTVTSLISYSGGVVESIVTGPDEVRLSTDANGRVWKKTVSLAGLGEKEILYEYDQTGALAKLSFEPGSTSDALYVWYDYDELGRLTEIKSNRTNDEQAALTDAIYVYGESGNVDRINLGEAITQSVDYAYDIRGRVTAINDLNSPGTDLFSMALGYDKLGEIGSAQGATPRKNGNLSWMAWRASQNTFPYETVGYTFEYDDLNRLRWADFGTKSGSWMGSPQYDVGPSIPISYDRNGNIKILYRKNDPVLYGGYYDYQYTSGSNRLSFVQNDVPVIKASYDYDANGNVKAMSGIRTLSNMAYDYRNLPTSLTVGGATYTYRYDGDGQRIYKSRSGGGDTAYYIRGIDGKTLAVYDGCGSMLYWNVLAGGEVIGKALPDTQPGSCSQ